jgi:hypothetical protein
MSAQTPESKVKKKLTDMLKKHAVWYFFPPNNGLGKSGVPDLIGCVNGVFFGVECKADAKKLATPLQIACGKAIRAAGGYWFLVYDNDSIAQVEEFILRWAA